jgi:hypothetical protein
MNASATSQHALLIIDDHPVYREALGEALAKEFSTLGVEVKTASNASEGMTLVDESNHTWIVLLDMLMPSLTLRTLCLFLAWTPMHGNLEPSPQARRYFCPRTTHQQPSSKESKRFTTKPNGSNPQAH